MNDTILNDQDSGVVSAYSVVFMAASLHSVFKWMRAEGKRGDKAVVSQDGGTEALPLSVHKDPNPLPWGSAM